MRRAGATTLESLRCSFCHKSQDDVGKLISSPSDAPRAYICDECVAVCASIIEDDRLPAGAGPTEKPHPLLSHPLASQLLASVERWIRRESLAGDAAEELAALRTIAIRMMS